MTPLTHEQAQDDVHVMCITLLAVSMESAEAAGLLGISAELLAVRESLEALNHAALKSVSEVH